MTRNRSRHAPQPAVHNMLAGTVRIDCRDRATRPASEPFSRTQSGLARYLLCCRAKSPPLISSISISRQFLCLNQSRQCYFRLIDTSSSLISEQPMNALSPLEKRLSTICELARVQYDVQPHPLSPVVQAAPYLRPKERRLRPRGFPCKAVEVVMCAGGLVQNLRHHRSQQRSKDTQTLSTSPSCL